MSKLLHTTASLLFKGRYILFIAALGVTGYFTYFALTISFNFSPETIFMEEDDAYQFYQNSYLPQFSDRGSPGVVAIFSKNPDVDISPALKRAEEILAKNDSITQVLSPLNQPIVVPTQQGIRLFPATDARGKLSQRAKDYYSEHPLYENSFMSERSNSLSLIFMMKLSYQNYDAQEAAIESIQQDLRKLESEFSSLQFYVTGLPFIQSEMISLLKSDQLRFIPFLALFLIVLLLLMTKNFFGAFMPLFVIFIAMIWTVGFLSAMSHDINVVNQAIIVLIMVIGIADAVHVYTRFIDESVKALRKRKNASQPINKPRIVIKTLHAMLVPCFLTTATTSLGFLASSAAGVTLIKQFGIDAAIGVLFCFITTFCMMPLFLWLHPIPKSHSPKWMTWWPKRLSIDSILRSVISFSLRHHKMLAATAIIFLLAALYLGKDITANQTWVGELPHDNPQTVALEFVETNFSGVMPFYVVFSGNKKDLQSYETALAIHAITKKLRSHPIGATVRSPIDPIVYLLNKNPQSLDLDKIDPDTFNEIRSALDSFADKDSESFADNFWNKDGTLLRLQGFLPNIPTGEVEDFRSDLDSILKSHALKKVESHVTGAALISSRALHNITYDMAQSLVLAVLYITIFVAVFFRSLRYALVAVLPNILPIAVTIACMRIFGIDVRLATVMIFSMALGLSVDTCVHLLCRVQEEIAALSNRFNNHFLIRSIHHAFKGSGRPIIYTTIILLGGFSIMMLSNFNAMRDFASIAAVVLLSAFIANIFLLPATIWITRMRKKRNKS